MDQLFKALPRDLQWEILETFVGTHVVRNGKLMRKMIGNIQARLIKTMAWNPNSVMFDPFGGMFVELCLKRKQIQSNSFLGFDNDIVAKTYVSLCKLGRCIYVCELPATREILYLYVTRTDSFTVPLVDSVILPPFKKNNYPSYPYTDKKKGVCSKKVALYSPKMRDDKLISKYYHGF
jgi:hypothetical protein